MNFNLSSVNEDIKINPTMQMLNYQFSNPNSSIYFLPINQMLAINHNNDRRPSGKIPNAKLKWAEWDKKSKYVLQRPLEDLRKESYSTMVMDVIATRDIAQDEEIFIDYGKEWEDAWIDHERRWRSPCNNGRMSSIFIKEMNDDKYNTSYHNWSDNHFIVCSKPEKSKFKIVYISQNATSPSYTKEGDLITNNFNGIDFNDQGFKYTGDTLKTNRYPCKIWNTDFKKRTMKVVLFFGAESAIEIQTALPDSQVTFVPKPFKSDMHLPDAFRHEIEIPDEIFPHQW
eukprot:CAMPEP_0194155524 /NCGR_PEP_ID=MMETSP0152-20130528/64960_1 /TAXON_ID=1049557 /ORGANISM="Thalassiothrix antarctica, Strain L6-D1" /LENGTH=284 /DNA_ID=CAMNT_0038862469 /DNA_START=83 /DNA_END=934 /DNA_ORIENTATION=-